jgi:hypothetical protein
VGGDEVAEGFLFPFACVSEHTWFAEATDVTPLVVSHSNPILIMPCQHD